jgi:hypothetical protein
MKYVVTIESMTLTQFENLMAMLEREDISYTYTYERPSPSTI